MIEPTEQGAPTPPGDDRGDFFAVDRRAWHVVCSLGMNPAIAYLVTARDTGGDNRTTKWSTNAIEGRTGISRSRARDAIMTGRIVAMDRCVAAVHQVGHFIVAQYLAVRRNGAWIASTKSLNPVHNRGCGLHGRPQRHTI